MESSLESSERREFSSFTEDFERAMHALRGASTEALAASGVEPGAGPAEVQRSIGVTRNLAWKLTKLIHSTNVYESVTHVPGQEGLEILMGALAGAGADAAAVERLRAAAVGFERMIEAHVGDRKNLELYVSAAMPGGVCGAQMEASRALGYRCNSATFGVQTRVDFSVTAVALNADQPDHCDMGSAKGMLGFRRLRETASWPILRTGYEQLNLELGQTAPEPLDERDGKDDGFLVHDFCSSPLPETRSVRSTERVLYELTEGPVGRQAAVDCVFGSVHRKAVPAFGPEGDESVGEYYFTVETPAERMQFDLLLHVGLPFPMPPKLVTCSKLHGEPSFPYSRHTRSHLPGVTNLQDLGRGRGAVVTPHIPRYGELVGRLCERLGHRVEDFRAYRLSLTHPPIPVVFVAYHPLARRRT